MQSDWDTKALIKEIVSSQVYQQRSIADTKTMTDDPENQWLARGPRLRLSAEMIRDNALSAAGLIEHQLGGAPIYAYEMTEAFKPVTPSAGKALYRRSLYAHWRRTSPPPAMMTFDAPKRSVCVAKRENTDTPLQALVLMNGTQYVEAARALGQNALGAHKDDVGAMVHFMFQRCMSRAPSAKESAICVRLHSEQLDFYQSHPREAEALLKHGRLSVEKSLAPEQLAAATILAQALLSHDECVVKH
jgi:hypothetical protein